MNKLELAISIAGASAVVSQALIIREGLALFSGNELTFGIMLFCWLVGTGLGSLIAGGRPRTKGTTRILAAGFWVLTLAVVFALGFLRFAPLIFNLPYGEVVSLGRMIIISGIALIPCGLIFGAIFPIVARLIPPVRAYFYEGVGSFLGGLLFSLFFLPILPSLGIIAVMIAALILAGVMIRSHRFLYLLALLPLLLLVKIGNIEFYLRRLAAGKSDLIAAIETKYGRSSIFRSGRQYDFFVSGVYDFSYPDDYRAEAAVHFPLLLHPDPQRVLLVGGGLGGSRREIFKHPSVRQLTYAELDPQFYRWAGDYLPPDTADLNNYRTVFGDARLYIKNALAQFDVIIINLPDPVNGQLNRFYTREFFAEARRALRPGGILAVGVSAPPDILSPYYAEFLRTVRSAVIASFAWERELPAAKLLMVAADRDPGSGDLADRLERRIAERNLKTLYVNGSYVRANLDREKLDYYRQALDRAPDRQNRDLQPVCYYFAIVLWSGLGTGLLKAIFLILSRLNPIWLFLPIFMIFFFFRRRVLIYLSLMASGATGLGLEVVMMVQFQARYGFVYGWLAALIAAFMAGIAAGAWIYEKRYSNRPAAVGQLSNWNFVNAGIMGLAILTAVLRLPGANLYIPGVLLVAGLINGLGFSLVLGLVGANKAGLIYGLDLVGSSLAALAVSIIFIPLAGIVGTLLGFMVATLLIATGLRTLT
jgi:spermidine synthase